MVVITALHIIWIVVVLVNAVLLTLFMIHRYNKAAARDGTVTRTPVFVIDMGAADQEELDTPPDYEHATSGQGWNQDLSPPPHYLDLVLDPPSYLEILDSNELPKYTLQVPENEPT